MYIDVCLQFCVITFTYVSCLDVTNTDSNLLQTDAGQPRDYPSKFLPNLRTDVQRTMDKSVPVKNMLLPKYFASWLIPRPSHVDNGDLKGMARPVIGREDDGNDGRISLGVMNHMLDKMGDNKLRLDHLSGRQRKTYSEDNSFDLTQSDINLAHDGWPDNEPAYSVRPIPRKRGYQDFSSQYGGSLHFRSWSRNEQLRLNRFSPPRRHFRRPTVSVTVDGTIFDPDVLFTQNITPEPEMSVFRALMSAALTFRRQQRAGAENPFNVMLDWDYQNDCEAIADIFGMTNSDRHLWRIYVRRRRGRVVYRGVCFPPERVLVRPGTRVTLQYS